MAAPTAQRRFMSALPYGLHFRHAPKDRTQWTRMFKSNLIMGSHRAVSCFSATASPDTC